MANSTFIGMGILLLILSLGLASALSDILGQFNGLLMFLAMLIFSISAIIIGVVKS